MMNMEDGMEETSEIGEMVRKYRIRISVGGELSAEATPEEMQKIESLRPRIDVFMHDEHKVDVWEHFRYLFPNWMTDAEFDVFVNAARTRWDKVVALATEKGRELIVVNKCDACGRYTIMGGEKGKLQGDTQEQAQKELDGYTNRFGDLEIEPTVASWIGNYIVTEHYIFMEGADYYRYDGCAGVGVRA